MKFVVTVLQLSSLLVFSAAAWGQQIASPPSVVFVTSQADNAIVCWPATVPVLDPQLIGVAKISGTEKDQTGLTNVLASDTPHNQFGGVSGIDWIPGTDKFRVLSDRGPQDGAVDFFCRFHDIELQIDPATTSPVTAKILNSTLLKNPYGLNFVGASKALTADATRAQRLDPEGIRVDRNGFTWISDEYGPHLFCFHSNGNQLQEIPMPWNLKVDFSSANPDEEDQGNKRGRRSNRGMEGLAITPCGCKLVGIMQSPLLQDGYTDDEGKIVGYNSRLICFDLKSGQTQQFVYRQEHEKHKLHEILAIDEQRFLVLEQDGKFGNVSTCKRIFMIDLKGATDVSSFANLPGRELPPGVVPVSKSPVLDMLDPRFGLAETMPEKIEGISWGKTLADGRKTLVVVSDNDFRKEQESMFYVFALQASANDATLTGASQPK
jgi:hypothetical protein